MKLSELAKQIADYIAENGDAEAVVLEYHDPDHYYNEYREPKLSINDLGDPNDTKMIDL